MLNRATGKKESSNYKRKDPTPGSKTQKRKKSAIEQKIARGHHKPARRLAQRIAAHESYLKTHKDSAGRHCPGSMKK